MQDIYFKVLPEFKDVAKIPTKKYDDVRKEFGWDLYAAEEKIIPYGESRIIKTGICMQHSNPMVGMILKDRSKKCSENGLNIGAGVVDPSYTGEILINNRNNNFPTKAEREYMMELLKDYIRDRDPHMFEIFANLFIGDARDYHVKIGDKIVQGVLLNVIDSNPVVVDVFPDKTLRGESGGIVEALAGK